MEINIATRGYASQGRNNKSINIRRRFSVRTKIDTRIFEQDLIKRRLPAESSKYFFVRPSQQARNITHQFITRRIVKLTSVSINSFSKTFFHKISLT